MRGARAELEETRGPLLLHRRKRLKYHGIAEPFGQNVGENSIRPWIFSGRSAVRRSARSCCRDAADDYRVALLGKLIVRLLERRIPVLPSRQTRHVGAAGKAGKQGTVNRVAKLGPAYGQRTCPHGDQAIYDALVRLAQDFNSRYPLVDGQGNFGNIDGDNPAAMRYTESRLTVAAEALLEGIDEDAVDFVPDYDGSDEEPVVLPAAFPNLLANGSSGIAVGMATNIPRTTPAN